MGFKYRWLLEFSPDPEIGDLAATSSQRWYRFAQELSPSDEVLATLGDGTPALIARRVGAGKVVIVNASADDRWCDLPRRKSFVPLIDRLLSHVQTGGYRRSWTIGEPMTLMLSNDEATNRPPRVLSPSGKDVTVQLQSVGTRTWMNIADATEAGYYRVESSDGSTADFSLIVQPGREESRLESVDPEKFRAWWSPVEIEIEQVQGISESTANADDDRIVLEPWLIGLAGLCLLTEMFLVHWLCQKMNPAISGSHRRRRGFVAPLKEREAEREGATAP